MRKIAILGFGVVGSGVAAVLTQNAAHMESRIGQRLVLSHILDVRDFPDSVHAPLLRKSFAVIEQDAEVEVVAEVIGGTTHAYEYTKRALQAKKHVVTSNKELVATHGAELLRLAADNGVKYLFEASVGGGIPVISPLAHSLAANRITEITGILNGTCNYILSCMSQEHMSFHAVLAEAQRLGYAERDPSADINGDDTCRKICILASLAFGQQVYPQYVHTEGIADISPLMIMAAQQTRQEIKLLGRARRRQDGLVDIHVAPYLIPQGHPLHSVTDVFNAVIVTGDATGEVMFYGRGAGSLPTASAVCADMIDCLLDTSPSLMRWEDSSGDNTAPVSVFDGNDFTFSDGSRMRVLA